MQKFHAGAALLRNFFIDYSGGGASTRPGTRWIGQTKAAGARLIPFQPSSTLGYVLEFGQNYIRFISLGAYILESVVAIQSITGSPVTINSTANGYANGDWVFISGAYYIVINAAANSYQLTDLFGNNVTSLTGTSAQRVYTITTPYNTSDLFPNPATGNPGLKYVQDVTSLIICHPSYQPAILTINSANNWTYATINFGSTIATPTGLTGVSNLASGSFNYGYLVTAVDVNNQESAPSSPVLINNRAFINTTNGSNTISWTAVPGAISYNIYKTEPTVTVAVPGGASYGFIQNVTATTFVETTPGIGPDFSQTPPVPQNPFVGASVQSVTVTPVGTLTSVPSVTIDPPGSGQQATAYASLQAATITANGLRVASPNGMSSAVILNFQDGITASVGSFSGSAGSFLIQTLSLVNRGSVTGVGSTANNLTVTGSNLVGLTYQSGTASCTLRFGSIVLIQGGAGYTSVPNVTISAGSSTAVAVLGTQSAGNPGVPGFFQERLMLAAQAQAVQSYDMSQPNSFFNFNVSNPAQDDDAISGTIIGEELNDIRSLIPVPTGIVALTGKGAWLINGGGGISTNNPITPANQTANPQAFNGANDLKPVKVNLDVLYGTNKGNYVRDLAYNIYANIYTGSDISVLSNHLFFNFYLLDWAWSEEPFKTLWAVRNDGTLLSLGYVKEQDLIGWAHHDTNGQFLSTCSVIENVNGNIVDAVYLIVQRFINNQYVQYVERLADRYFTYGQEDAWCVDAGLQTLPQVSPTGTLTFSGDASAIGNSVTLTDTVDAPFTSAMASQGWVVRAGGGIYTITGFTSTSQVTATVTNVPEFINPYTNTPFPVTTGYGIWQPVTTVSGLTQLAGQTVTGLADGNVVPATVVSATGSVTLATAASKITLGLAFTPDLQTLPLDLGEPTVQGKLKKITALTVRVADTLGLSAGTSFSTLVAMKDFTIGNIGSQNNQLVTGLVDGDGRTVIDQLYQEAGSYCLRQTLPYPATVLGVFPEVTVEGRSR